VLLVIVLTGRSAPPAKPGPTATAASQAPSADRVREYQDRMRMIELRAAQETQAAGLAPTPPVGVAEPQATPPPDPIAQDRRRREYESLFASNVVLSRRPVAERPDADVRQTGGELPASTERGTGPSMDDIADAAVRATLRAGTVGSPSTPTIGTRDSSDSATSAGRSDVANRRDRLTSTEPIGAAGPLHRVLEGTVIDTVLTNRLDGSATSPVNCLVTNPVYSHSGQQVLIPAGARVLGETKPVQTFGETRLAVSFHRLLMPDGRTHSLDQFLGLNQIGDAGLRDRVNHHYLSMFGAAAAVGLISGLAQYLGTAGLGRGDGDRTIVVAGGTADATAQASAQVMTRFLNRLPTITVREGHRIKVYLTSDLELPAYSAPARPSF
jgi:type IV secretory pathway VirB10-like protein